MGEWRPVPGHPGYEVSAVGEVRNAKTGHLMKQTASNWGYMRTQIREGARRVQLSVHRAVATAFVPNPSGKPQVNHINGDKADNRAENLEWVTPSENVRKAFATGLHQKPSSEHMRRMLRASNASRRRPVIRSDGERFETVKDAATASGCGHSEVSGVLSGRRKTAHGYGFRYA